LPNCGSAGVSVGPNLEPLVGKVIEQEKFRMVSRKCAAEAERELARVRHFRKALIERVMAQGKLDCGKLVPSDIKQVRRRD
jgi:hypothetical protein